METTYTWEPFSEGSTRMTLRNRGEPSGFGRFAAPLMMGAMRRANRKDLERLKSILEGARRDPASKPGGRAVAVAEHRGPSED